MYCLHLPLKNSFCESSSAACLTFAFLETHSKYFADAHQRKNQFFKQQNFSPLRQSNQHIVSLDLSIFQLGAVFEFFSSKLHILYQPSSMIVNIVCLLLYKFNIYNLWTNLIITTFGQIQYLQFMDKFNKYISPSKEYATLVDFSLSACFPQNMYWYLCKFIEIFSRSQTRNFQFLSM